jgi:hypothetical protein
MWPLLEGKLTPIMRKIQQYSADSGGGPTTPDADADVGAFAGMADMDSAFAGMGMGGAPPGSPPPVGGTGVKIQEVD